MITTFFFELWLCNHRRATGRWFCLFFPLLLIAQQIRSRPDSSPPPPPPPPIWTFFRFFAMCKILRRPQSNQNTTEKVKLQKKSNIVTLTYSLGTCCCKSLQSRCQGNWSTGLASRLVSRWCSARRQLMLSTSSWRLFGRHRSTLLTPTGRLGGRDTLAVIGDDNAQLNTQKKKEGILYETPAYYRHTGSDWRRQCTAEQNKQGGRNTVWNTGIQ